MSTYPLLEIFAYEGVLTIPAWALPKYAGEQLYYSSENSFGKRTFKVWLPIKYKLHEFTPFFDIIGTIHSYETTGNSYILYIKEYL